MSEWTVKEHSTGELVVTISGEEWTKACRKAFNKLSKNLTIPGFRKGCVPPAMLKKYVNDERVRYEAIDANANEWFLAALKERELTPLDRPSMDLRNMSAESVDLVFEFPVYPEVKLGEYKGLPYDLGDISVSEEDVDNEINRMRETYADMEVKDGEAAKGDTVNIDYEGFKDGVPFEGGKADGFDLVLGSGSFIPGFEDQLIGVKAGEEKELNLTFPEDYGAEELAGAAVVFKVKVNEVKTKVLPEVNDDFAKDLSAPGVETVEDLRKTVRTRLETNKKNSAVRAADEALFAALAEAAEIDLPQVMIEDEITNMVRQFEAQIKQYGMELPNYLKMLNTTLEDLRAGYAEQAERSVRQRLVLEEIANAENFEVTEEDIKKEYQLLADMYQMELDAVRSQIAADAIIEDVRVNKAIDFVKENAAKG